MDLQFSIDQPFGLKLYPYFEKVYQIVVGRPAATFVFTPGVTPLSTNKEGELLSGTALVIHQIASSPASLP